MSKITHTAYITIKMDLHDATPTEVIAITDDIKARATAILEPKHWQISTRMRDVVVDWKVGRRIQRVR